MLLQSSAILLQSAKEQTVANLRGEAIDASLSLDLQRSKMQARDKGASSWLNDVPLEEQDLTLNRKHSWTGYACFTIFN